MTLDPTPEELAFMSRVKYYVEAFDPELECRPPLTSLKLE